MSLALEDMVISIIVALLGFLFVMSFRLLRVEDKLKQYETKIPEKIIKKVYIEKRRKENIWIKITAIGTISMAIIMFVNLIIYLIENLFLT